MQKNRRLSPEAIEKRNGNEDKRANAKKDTFTNWYEYRMRGINTHWQLDGDSKTQSGCQSPLKIRLLSEQKTERGWGREKHTERLGQREVLITFETSGRSSNTENCVQDIQSKHTLKTFEHGSHAHCMSTLQTHFSVSILFCTHLVVCRIGTHFTMNTILLQTIYSKSFYFLITTNSIRNNVCT